MRPFFALKLFGLSLALTLAPGMMPGIMAGITSGVMAQEPSVFFLRSPRLVDAMTTFQEVQVWSAVYYFTIEVPSDVGQPLGKVTIHQRQGVQQMSFDLSQTLAFMGTPDERGQPISVMPSWDETTQTVSVILNPPVPPGSTVTVGIKPWQNPDFSGIYLYGVTAYPPGEKTQGLYLGVGRLQFSRGGGQF